MAMSKHLKNDYIEVSIKIEKGIKFTKKYRPNSLNFKYFTKKLLEPFRVNLMFSIWLRHFSSYCWQSWLLQGWFFSWNTWTWGRNSHYCTRSWPQCVRTKNHYSRRNNKTSRTSSRRSWSLYQRYTSSRTQNTFCSNMGTTQWCSKL